MYDLLSTFASPFTYRGPNKEYYYVKRKCILLDTHKTNLLSITVRESVTSHDTIDEVNILENTEN